MARYTTVCMVRHHMIISAHAHTQDGNDYRDAVFNNTVDIRELEETFDAET